MIINWGDAPFKAFIKVTYNAGTCTCKMGSETFTHSGGGTATFEVKKKGTWVVTVTGRLESKSSNVDVSKSGTTYSVTINVNQSILYQSGNEYTSITGGWTNLGLIIAGGLYPTAPSITRNSDHLYFVQANGSRGGVVYMSKKINLSGVNTLSMKIRTNAVDERTAHFYIWNSVSSSYVASKNVNLNNNGSGSYATVTIDVSSLNSSYYLGFGFCAYGVNIELRLNELKLT